MGIAWGVFFWANCDSFFKVRRSATSLKSLKINRMHHRAGSVFWGFLPKMHNFCWLGCHFLPMRPPRHITSRALIKFHSGGHLYRLPNHKNGSTMMQGRLKVISELQMSGQAPMLDWYQNHLGDGCCSRKGTNLCVIVSSTFSETNYRHLPWLWRHMIPPCSKRKWKACKHWWPLLLNNPRSVAVRVVFLKDRLIFYSIIGEKWGVRRLRGGDWWE